MTGNKQVQQPLLPTTASGLPPYTEIAESGASASGSSSAIAMEDWHTHAQNNILVSRNFRSITNTRFTVDPNMRPFDSLLRPVSSWEDEDRDGSSKTSKAVELYVGCGQVDAEVCLLSVSESVARVCKQNGYPCCQPPVRRPYSIREDPPPPCPMQSRVSAGTLTGDVTLKVDVGKLSPRTPRLHLRAYTSWGQVAVFLPRSFHGPLVTSCSGTPRLSSSLAPVCAPIKEVGSEKRWFVGNVDAWHAAGEHADEASVSSSFGKVWVGYEGEEEEARKALRWGAVQWIAHIVPVLVILGFMRMMLAFLLWFLRLVSII
ncbi:hypothetical protein FB45DRAFT_796863 [Roridomyces roridus]|uniref:DUF7330 domain-containing protein n=1 Tax=Roridomyces roridus TaxID=1738132 RepID=A0AAD7FKF2_9AGAR|nr:hypothetical protein FB45DRAFT_796863 [Roridomyces roridus]